jgi:hypothetical protein
LLNSTRQLQFGDSGTYIHQSADGVLDLVSDTEIEINATTVDMNGNLDLSGTLNSMTIAASGITGPSGQNFAINTPNSLRINIDSDNNGTSEVFVVGHNRTDVGTTDALFKVTEAGTSTFFSTATTDTVVLQSTDTGASAAPDLVLFRDSSSPADGDDIGNILFRGKDDGGNETSYAFIMGEINDASDGSEDGNLFFRTQSAGSLDNRISIVSDKVGIGTDSPSSGKLEVKGAKTQSGGAPIGNVLIADSTSLAANTGGAVTFQGVYQTGGAITGFASIEAMKETATHNEYGGALVFKTRQDQGSMNEHMRITSTGLIGIGTSSPSHEIEIHSASPTIEWSDSDDNYRSQITQSGSAFYFDADAGAGGSSSMRFRINGGTEAMRIDASGSVGIGTSSPGGSTSCLHVVHDATEGTPSFPDGEVIIAQRNFNSSQGCHIGIIAGTASESAVNFGDKDDSDIGGISYNHSTNAMHLRTSATNRLNIDSDGHVGINMTASPVANDKVLSIYESNTPRIKLHNSSTGTAGTDGGELNMTGTDFIIENRESGNLRLFTNGSERIRINNAGLVSIGTTTTDRELKVQKSGDHSIIAAVSGTSNLAGMVMGDTDDDDTGAVLYNNNGNYLYFQTNTSERVRIAANGTTIMAVGNDNCLHLNTSVASGTGRNLIRAFSDSSIDSDGNVRFVVFDSGNVQNTNNSYGAISDQNRKENIVDATDKLDEINQVRIRNFNFIGDSQKQIGVIAQELETIFPSMVEDIQDQDSDGNLLETTTKSVKYSVFVPILIKGIQEQQTIIDDLKSRIETLEG